MRKLLLLGVSLPILVAGAPAFAQAGDGVDEIIVTAQKRVENVQDVPIAIAAISGEAMQSRGVTEVAQLANYTPSVQLSNSSQIVSSPSSLSGFIRGIGQDDFSAAFEPGVGTYVDGVYLARTVGANANLLDVERIEILKGPQGTLFGRNTIGGAISVVTREPADELAARGQVTVGRFNRKDASLALDVPLIEDRLLSSVAVAYSSRNGWQHREVFPGVNQSETVADFVPSGSVQGLGSRNHLGGGHELNARGKLLWKGDGFRVTLAADYSRARQGASPYNLIRTAQVDPGGNPTLAGLYNICIGTPSAVLGAIGLGAVCGPRVGPGTGIAGVNVDADPANDLAPYDDRYVSNDLDVTYGSGNNYSRLRNYGFAGTIDIDLSDDITLKSITAYRNQKWDIGLDIDGSPAIIFEPTISQSQHQFSQEFQLNGSSLDDRLKWVAGLYYFDEAADEEQDPIFGGGVFSVLNPISFKTKSYAAFAHLNFAITDQLGITVGGRYTEEQKRFWPSQIDTNLFLQKLLALPPFLYADPNDLSQLQPTELQKQKFNDFSPRLGVEFKPNDDVMLYGSYSRGYKSGGWTTRVTAPVLEAPTFKEETADTIEFGIKSTLLDRKLQINAAAFTTKYKDIQLLIQRGVSPTFENAGDARIKGLELEVKARLAEGLRLNASVGYIDAHYTRVDDPTGVIQMESDLPKVAKWTAHFGPEYRLDMGNDSALTLRADYFYRSRVASDSENTPELYGKARSTIDLSATYALPGDKLSLSVGGKNVFNERYIVNGTNQLAGAGMLFATYNQPAEWYVSARFDF